MAEAGCKRDGSFQNMEIAGRTEIAGVATVTAGSFANGALETKFATVARTALTVTAETQTLTKNTHYTMAATNPDSGVVCALVLPTQATSVKGDFITITLGGAIANGDTIKIGTAGEFFTAGSKVFVEGQDGTRGNVIDFADGTADDFLNIVGLSNGDGGIGTFVSLYFNGSTWSIDAHVTGQGAQSAASASTVFATS